MQVVPPRGHPLLSHCRGHFFRNHVPLSFSLQQLPAVHSSLRVPFVTVTPTRLITLTDAAHADTHSHVMLEAVYL